MYKWLVKEFRIKLSHIYIYFNLLWYIFIYILLFIYKLALIYILLSGKEMKNMQSVQYSSRFALGLFYDYNSSYFDDVSWVAKYISNDSVLRYCSIDHKKRSKYFLFYKKYIYKILAIIFYPVHLNILYKILKSIYIIMSYASSKHISVKVKFVLST